MISAKVHKREKTCISNIPINIYIEDESKSVHVVVVAYKIYLSLFRIRLAALISGVRLLSSAQSVKNG